MQIGEPRNLKFYYYNTATMGFPGGFVGSYNIYVGIYDIILDMVRTEIIDYTA